jgi:hypothetical protein
MSDFSEPIVSGRSANEAKTPISAADELVFRGYAFGYNDVRGNTDRHRLNVSVSVAVDYTTASDGGSKVLIPFADSAAHTGSLYSS